MNTVWDDAFVAAYQELLIKEYDRNKSGLKEPPDNSSLLSNDEVISVCKKHGVDPDFFKSKVLVEYPNNCWRTIHFDLIYRLIHIRNIELQAPIPLEHRIEMHKELVPDYERHQLNQILPKLIQNRSVLEIVNSALTTHGYRALSSHQLPFIDELLTRKTTCNVAAIVAPTASGKTITFFIPVLVRAIERILQGETGVSSILIYPRKALERDQLQKFIKIIDTVNQKGCHITIGIDDGDTKRLKEINDGDTYRELKCPQCSGNLIVVKQEETTLVKCKSCSKEYPYIFASKDEIWQNKPTILITNIYTLYRRLLTETTVGMFSGVDYVILDEAHVYTDYLGGHVSYIIKILKHATSTTKGSKPYFVFSSATISNPVDFIAQLAGCRPGDVFYVKYDDAIKNQNNGSPKYRLMLYLYLLPRPDSSVETLTEALILAVTLWSHKHDSKAITFVDSVAEISTLTDYIHTTILGKREGREVIDHFYGLKNNSIENSYNWLSLAPTGVLTDRNTFKSFVLNKYKDSIGIHYAQLPLPQRATIESEFLKGNKKLLLSTSTLELGIDLSDIAAIIQYKLPMSPEAFVQRVGRAGRNNKCLRVALGIIALSSTPLSTIYMFDEDLRKKLYDSNFLPPARVGRASTNVKLQHALSLLLYKRALKGRRTYIAENLTSKRDVINAVTEILNDLNNEKELLEFNQEVDLFDQKTISDQIRELKSKLNILFSNNEQSDFNKDDWDNTLLRIESKSKIIRETIDKIADFIDKLGKIKQAALNRNVEIQSIEKVLEKFEKLKSIFDSAYYLCVELYKAAQSSYRNADKQAIQVWFDANFNKVKKLANDIINIIPILMKSQNITVKSIFLHEIYNQIYQYDNIISQNCDFSLSELTNIYTGIIKFLEDSSEEAEDDSEGGLVRFLLDLPKEVEKLVKTNISGLIANEAFSRVENEIKDGKSINIFDAINLLLLNKTTFSLLLEPPAPELRLEGVDES